MVKNKQKNNPLDHLYQGSPTNQLYCFTVVCTKGSVKLSDLTLNSSHWLPPRFMQLEMCIVSKHKHVDTVGITFKLHGKLRWTTEQQHQPK